MTIFNPLQSSVYCTIFCTSPVFTVRYFAPVQSLLYDILHQSSVYCTIFCTSPVFTVRYFAPVQFLLYDILHQSSFYCTIFCTSFNIENIMFCLHSAFVCFVWISGQRGSTVSLVRLLFPLAALT
jgi:hypothetical protein